MKEDSKSIKTTSRRQFTRTMVTAAVAAPIAASMVGCKGGPAETSTSSASPSATTGATEVSTGPCLCPAIEKSGYTEIQLGLGQIEEHIPPMGIDGVGSLTIDSKNKLKEEGPGGGSGPFTYIEDGVADENRYGVIRLVLVVEELADQPYLIMTLYKGFVSPGTGTQLLLWYQNISPDPGDADDTTYPPATFPDDPDLRLVGGKGTNLFRMVMKSKRLDPGGQSHKPGRPHRYRHSDGGPLARHFRIGRWRLVDSAGTTLVEKSGADNYTFHLLYNDYQKPL